MRSDFADKATDGERDLIISRYGERFFINVVAAENFIGALAGHHDLQIFGSRVAHEIECHGGRVGKRLVHVVLNLAEVAPELFRGNRLAVILHRNQLGKLLCVADLVVFFAVVKADRKRLVHIGRAGHIAGIHAGGKERADFNVRNLVCVHGVVKGLFNLVYPIFKRLVFFRVEFRDPVALYIHFAVFVEEIMCRRQLVNVLEERLVARRILERKVALQCAFIQLALKVRVFHKALDFAAEHQRALHLCIVKRLNAKVIARAEQRFRILVPNDEREHAAQLIEQVGAVFFKAVQQHFAVRFRCEYMACL